MKQKKGRRFAVERKRDERITTVDDGAKLAEDLEKGLAALEEIAQILQEAGVDKAELEKRTVEDVRAFYRARYGLLGR